MEKVATESFPGRQIPTVVFEQMMEQRDIKMAINTLMGEGFTSGEIQEAVQNRLSPHSRLAFPGGFLFCFREDRRTRRRDCGRPNLLSDYWSRSHLEMDP